MISESKFISDLQKMIEISEQTMENPWIIRKASWRRNSIWAENSEFVISKSISKKFRRVSSLCYSESYNVPVFWFNFYDIDGKLLHFDQFKQFAFIRPQEELDLREIVTQAEHPFLGIAFYNLHPCKTAELMRPILMGTNNYVLSFLSTLGSIFVINWSMQFFAEGLVVKTQIDEPKSSKHPNVSKEELERRIKEKPTKNNNEIELLIE